MNFDVQSIVDYLLQKEGVVLGQPWGPGTRAFKVNGKIFAVLDEENPPPYLLNLRCGAMRSIKLQLKYDSVQPHRLHKKSWVTVILDGSISESEFFQLLDCAYKVAVESLSDNPDLDQH